MQILTGFDCRLVGFSILVLKIQAEKENSRRFLQVLRPLLSHGRRD